VLFSASKCKPSFILARLDEFDYLLTVLCASRTPLLGTINTVLWHCHHQPGQCNGRSINRNIPTWPFFLSLCVASFL
jgi:hypothetical protein